ncbi:MAG: hypothetical protein LBB74_08615 [Chitinispirillales bacterium]|nr:hypothetical protein [Chitinispirillales bacterium]
MQFVRPPQFDDKVVSIVEHIRLMATPGGEVYGFATKDGKIYLDPEKMNANTPIHEYGHLWLDFAKKNHPELYRRMITAARRSDLMKELKDNPKYADLTAEERAEEVLARAIADKGEGMFKDESRQGTFQRLLRDLWEWVKNTLGVGDGAGLRGLSPEDVSRLTFGELSEGAARELLSGRRVGEAAEEGGKYIKDMEETGKKNVNVVTVDPSKIVDDDGNPIDLKSASQLRRWLINQYSGREIIVSDNGRTIRFTNQGLQDSLKRRGEAHQQVYAELDNLLENGIYAGNEPGDARHPRVERQDIYYTVAQIGAKTFGVRFKADIPKGKEYGIYKDHKVVEIDDVEEVNIKEPPSPYAGISPTGTEGGKSIPLSKIRGAMGLTDNIPSSAPKSKEKNKNLSDRITSKKS